MPHKRNPITAEKICGIARVIRGYVVPVMEGIALWHERDLSHSSVERVCVPDSAGLLDHVLSETTRLIDHLVVNVDRMAAGLRASEAATRTHAALVTLTDAGLGWSEAWRIVQAAAERTAGGDATSLDGHVAAAASDAGIRVPRDEMPGAKLPGEDLDMIFERLTTLTL
jgi:adenylosuccinate lyase